MKNLTKQRGTALIVALFITALIAAITVAMIDRLRVDTHRTSLLLNAIQANLYAEGAIDFAKEKLIDDWKQKQEKKLIDLTPIRIPSQNMNGTNITITIYDAQGKLNINNLTNTSFQTVFVRLLQLVEPKLDLTKATQLTRSIVEWITPNTQKISDSSIPHQLMTSISELRLIKGITPALYMRLSAYLTALPSKTLTNINSAPLLIIMAFNPSLSNEAVKSFDTLRKQTPIIDLNALSQLPSFKNNPLAKNNFTVTSEYFLVKTDIRIGNQSMRIYTLLLRVIKNNQADVITVWQSQGTL